MPQKSFVGQRPQRASAPKAKSSVLSGLSGLENGLFNDFIDDVLDSEDVSEQRVSASLPDSVPRESKEDSEGVVCMCFCVGVCVCVCVCVCVPSTRMAQGSG